MAESSEHTEEDLIPIQNFMRRFSHVDPRDQEPSRQSLIDAAAAEAAKQPTRNNPASIGENLEILHLGPPAPPPRESTRHDWLLLPMLKAKDWLVDHPKTTTAICTCLFSTVANRMPYYDMFHKWVCWCMENEACVVGFILKRAKFMILCI